MTVSLGFELTIRDHVKNSMRTSDFVLCIACDDIEPYAPHIFLSDIAYDALKNNRYGETFDEIDEKGREFLYNIYYHNEENQKVENVELFIISKSESHLYRIIGCYRWPSRPVCVNKGTYVCIKNFLYHHNRNVLRFMQFPRAMRKEVVYIQ